MSRALDEQLYVYPGTDILRNHFDLRDAQALAHKERFHSSIRLAQTPPPGRFDLDHLQALHHHLFQDVYPWAGEIRQVPLAKGGSHFMPPGRIVMGMTDIHRRLSAQDFLKHRDAQAFARGAAEIIGDINHLHPFRDGNGRAQLLYLRELGRHAGHDIQLERIDKNRWHHASRAAHYARYDPMARAIEHLVAKRRQYRETATRTPQIRQPRRRPR